MTGLVGAVVEAWDELRIHRLRVLLALIGVAVAVAAITAVTAAVQMLTQAFQEQAERSGGRSVTLTVGAWPTGPDAVEPEDLGSQYQLALERYGIEYASRDQWGEIPVRLPEGTTRVPLRAVDPDLGVMNRIAVEQGRWFAEHDRDAFAPMLVVNEPFLAALGLTDLSSHPTVLLGDDAPVRARIIGVTAQQWPGQGAEGFWLYDHLQRWWEADDPWGPSVPSLSVWVPPDQADGLRERLVSDVQAAAPGWQVDAWDNREAWGPGLDGAARWVGLGIGGFALLLGGLGLVNIALVTVRYRIREIGIRRSFGATSGRIFFGVLMESVVATAVAGVVGVALAVAVIKAVPIETVLGGPLQDAPPFPVSAAVVGMVAACGVGTLAGLIPATVAVRVKVIDAIRY